MIVLCVMFGTSVFLPIIRKKGDGEKLTDAEATRFSARRLARWTFALTAWIIVTGISGIVADLLDDLPAWQDALISACVMTIVIMSGLYFAVALPYRHIFKAWHRTDYEQAQARLTLWRFAHPFFGQPTSVHPDCWTAT